ncbi:hypothetical protein BA919_08730, partial [Helicobacter pullorum]|uniref:two-partner secretion domain-containing protein n=1 Tax=Helicobacter pullorum TaxID=35818 RepID=UPI0008169346
SNSKIQDSIKLESIKDSNSIQSKQSKTTITKIGISIVASIVLSQSLVALPSGGKFTSGNGSITTSGNTMNIIGNNKNHIIAWGGGFNINKGESVNFNTSHKQQASFLNLDYTNKASQILGNLNGNGNNIYLVNPSGVLIGQNANINANKFVASNTIDDKTLNNFKTQTKLVETFSPVFQPNKGNIVNLGTIKANNGITLIGDTIDIRGGKLENKGEGNNKNDSIYFVGENIYIDADATSLSSNNNVYATAFSEGYIQRQMNKFQKDNFQFGDFKNLIANEKYDYQTQGNLQGSSTNFKKAITLGNMGDSKANVAEWSYFADFINGVKTGSTKPSDIDEYRLVGDIDFGGINYADYNGSSLIVGKDSTNAFTSSFNGNGYKLSNIDIEIKNSPAYNLNVGVFGNAENATIGNLGVENIDIDIEIKNSPAYNLNVGVFGNAKNATIGNLGVENIDIDIALESKSGMAQIGSLVGYVKDSLFNNIVIENVDIVSNSSSSNGGQEMIGGVFGWLSATNLNTDSVNQVLVNDINIKVKQANLAPSAYVGGFSGYNKNVNISDIWLSNLRLMEVNVSGNPLVGGSSPGINVVGGFAGQIDSVNLENIAFVGVNTINVEGSYLDKRINVGGFVGSIQRDNNLENIYLFFNEDAEILNALKDNGGITNDTAGKFYGQLIGNNISFDNVNLYYNANPDTSLANPIKNASNNTNYYNTENTSNPDKNKIILKAYSDADKGYSGFEKAVEAAGITPPSGSGSTTNPDSSIDLGNVTLEQEDFVGIETTIQEIINEILNESYHINITGFDVATMQLGEISSMINEILKGIQTKQSEDMLDYKINQLFNLLLVSNDSNKVESLKQSLNFLRAFYDGDNGLKDDFAKWYSKDNSIDKYSYVKDSILKLKSFINGEGNYNGNGLINQISSINNNLKALESLKQKIKAVQKYYQEALEAKLPYETLEGIYNEMVKIIDESYAKAQSLLNTLESEDKVYLTNLLREYSIKENSGFDDITGTFTFNGENLQANLDKTILAGLSDKPNLTPPTKEEVGDDPTKENNPDVPNNLQKIADLASKEAILILPAQEKQEAIVEDGKERGRLCIVSDNAKTNNPCMAITY